MNSIYNIYSMFSDPIEPLLYSPFLPFLSPLEETEDHKILLMELIQAKTTIRKLKYEEECAQNGEISASTERQTSISALESRVATLSAQSPAPQIRQSIHRIMRKCLIYENWEQLHCLYVDSAVSLCPRRSMDSSLCRWRSPCGTRAFSSMGTS